MAYAQTHGHNKQLFERASRVKTFHDIARKLTSGTDLQMVDEVLLKEAKTVASLGRDIDTRIRYLKIALGAAKRLGDRD
ncbi:MAG: hypothetical protein KGH62_03580, partial [Candidatus Micrarchaeota archaeon]|nr:hypothetical protein [Candidatus Micrarchaeota archaeon]